MNRSVLRRSGSRRLLRHAWQGLRRFGHGSMNLLYAQQCACCHAPLPGAPDLWLCQACMAQLSPPPVARCRPCGVLLPPGVPEGGVCRQCERKRLKFETVLPLGTYDGELRRAVLQLKRPGQESLALAMGELLWRQAGERLAELNLDGVVPVPMHWRRRLFRGVNSAELLAEPLARALRIPLVLGLLRRSRNTPPQTELTPLQRFRNIRGAFRISKGYHLESARLLLVDDVLTTGATCSEAAQVLRQAGASHVSVAVAARTAGSPRSLK